MPRATHLAMQEERTKVIHFVTGNKVTMKGTILPSTLANQFIAALNDQDIEYCHWKSNFALTETTGIDGDLDFLVDRRMLPRIQTLLFEHGFKPATVKWGPNPLSIYHYYGLESETGELVHVHLFSNVLTGESFIKSHLLPFERMLLENISQMGEVKVVNRSAELVLFFVRTCIKYGSGLDLVYLLRKPEVVQQELTWLQAGSNLDETLRFLRCYCPVIDEALFRSGLAILAKPGATLEKIRLAHRVRKQLKVYTKFTPIQQWIAYVQLFWQHAQRRLSGQRRNKALSAGGAVIAFIGPEATGKSTLVSESQRWLGSVFAVRSIHAGKPPSTWLTFPVNGFAPLLRKIAPDLRPNRLDGHIKAADTVQAPEEAEAPPKIEKVAAILYAIRAVAVAWDRRALLIKARRAAAQGEIVICDRYPSQMTGAMDSPRLQVDRTKQGVIPKLYNWLAEIEHRLYHQIPPPDVAIKLSVSIETAKQRNRDRIKAGKESDAYVESRHRQVRNWQRPGTKYIHDISTEHSLPETIRSVKQVIWSSL